MRNHVSWLEVCRPKIKAKHAELSHVSWKMKRRTSECQLLCNVCATVHCKVEPAWDVTCKWNTAQKCKDAGWFFLCTLLSQKTPLKFCFTRFLWLFFCHFRTHLVLLAWFFHGIVCFSSLEVFTFLFPRGIHLQAAFMTEITPNKSDSIWYQWIIFQMTLKWTVTFYMSRWLTFNLCFVTDKVKRFNRKWTIIRSYVASHHWINPNWVTWSLPLQEPKRSPQTTNVEQATQYARAWWITQTQVAAAADSNQKIVVQVHF